MGRYECPNSYLFKLIYVNNLIELMRLTSEVFGESFYCPIVGNVAETVPLFTTNNLYHVVYKFYKQNDKLVHVT